MPKYIVDTDTGTCVPYDTSTYGVRLLSLMETHLGTREYDGIAATIQKWYYGSLVKAAWCATCLSYFLDQAGIKGVKEENVFNLLTAARNSGKGKVILVGGRTDDIFPGDIVFLLFSNRPMTTTSSKHVTVATGEQKLDTFVGRGGNQNDSLCDKHFNKSDIYAIWRV